jgi:hypothetical protein
MWKAAGCRLLRHKLIFLAKGCLWAVWVEMPYIGIITVLNIVPSTRTLLSSLQYCSVSTIAKFLMGGTERSFCRLRFHSSERMVRGEVKRNWIACRIKAAFTHVFSAMKTLLIIRGIRSCCEPLCLIYCPTFPALHMRLISLLENSLIETPREWSGRSWTLCQSPQVIQENYGVGKYHHHRSCCLFFFCAKWLYASSWRTQGSR